MALVFSQSKDLILFEDGDGEYIIMQRNTQRKEKRKWTIWQGLCLNFDIINLWGYVAGQYITNKKNTLSYQKKKAFLSS